MAIDKTLRVTFIANTASMSKSIGKMNKELGGFNKQIELGTAGMKVSNRGTITDMKTRAVLDKNQAAMRMGNHRIETKAIQNKAKAMKSMRNIQLGAHLSMMFMGMQLARTFNNILRSIKTTYDAATQGNTELGKGTTRLGASWEFLKFSIFNALNQPGMISFIDFLVNGIKWLGEWISEHKALGVAIMAAFGVLAVGGTILMMVGQFSLFWFAVFGPAGLIAMKAAAGMGTTAAAAGTVTGAAATMMTALGVIVGGGIILFVLLDIFGRGDEPMTASRLFTHLGFAAIAGFMLGGPLGAFASASIIFLIDFAMAGGFGKKLEEFKKKGTLEQMRSLLSPGFGFLPGTLGMDFFESFGKGLSDFLTGSKDVTEATGNMTTQTDLLNESVNIYSNEAIPGVISADNTMIESLENVATQVYGNKEEVQEYIDKLNEIPTEKTTVVRTIYKEEGRSSTF